MHNIKGVRLFIFFASLIIKMTMGFSEIDPSMCSNYYSANFPPPQQNCQNTTCIFNLGLKQLVSNKSSSVYFVLCINLPQYDFYVSQANSNQTSVDEIASLYIYVNNLFMSDDYSLLCQGSLVIYTQTLASFQHVSLTGEKIWIASYQDILINGSQFINESVVQTDCSCTNHQKTCNWTFNFPRIFDDNGNFNISDFDNQLDYTMTINNSAIFFAMNSLAINSTMIKYSLIGIFSYFSIIQTSSLMTSGLGYPSDSGPGCGYFDQVLNQLLGCMGSGGSHGGFGGNSSPQNCYLLVSKPPYDSIIYPQEPGSGGGFFLPHSRQSSSGGGVINIQSSNLFFNSSSILAQGRNGIQGGGGGAGGSISIDYNNLWTYSNITTVISANGGNGDKMSSSGSGGRIRLYNYNWKQFYNSSGLNLTISVDGGSGCRSTNIQNVTIQLSCGQRGSVYTSQCRPGTALSFPSYTCLPCAAGYYQLSYGYSNCTPCSPKPANSTWLQTNQSSAQSIYYYNSCNYSCIEGFEGYRGKCLSRSEYVFEKYNVTDLLISLGMIGAAVLIYFLIICIRKVSQGGKMLSFDNPNLNETYRKKFFRLEDLPYHQIRLYFSGQNHPYNPWKITQQSYKTIQSQMKNSPYSKILNLISKLIKQINKKSEYSRVQKLVLTSIRYTYYPLSRIILNEMRKQKSREIFEEVNKFNNKIPQNQSLGIKLHVKPQHTVASLQFFNYTKSVLDFYIQNYFPFYILLEKAPFNGYKIDFTDPFLKVFINQIIQKQVTGKSVENFLKQANKFLKNQSKFLSCLNYLWTLSDINPKFQAFLWQPTKQLLGVDKKYEVNKKQQLFFVICCQNLNYNHFWLNQRLTSPFQPEIEALKHKFNIRKDLATQQDGTSIWLINTQFGQKTVLWTFGILNTIFLLETLALFFINILIISDKMTQLGCVKPGWKSFSYGFAIYFIVEPFSDFVGAYLNFKVILSKNQYALADAVAFNILTAIKSLILFICVIISKNLGQQSSCLEPSKYLWLSMMIASLLIFIAQIILRARIIALAK